MSSRVILTALALAAQHAAAGSAVAATFDEPSLRRLQLEADATVGEAVTFEGFLVDIFCWDMPGHVAIDGAPLATDPARHTIHCMRDIPDCRANGFGVLEELADGTFDLKYVLDAVGVANALAYVDQAPDGGNVLVKVVGTLGAVDANGREVLEGATVEKADGSTIDEGVLPDVPDAPEPGAPDVEVSGCESDDPDFDFFLQLSSSLGLYWSVEDAAGDPALRGRMIKQDGGWAAIAFSDKGLMIGSEAVIGEPGAPPEAYILGGKSQAAVEVTDAVTLEDVSVAADGNGAETWDFVRRLGQGSVPAEAEGTAWGRLIFSEGSGGLGYHGRGNYGVLELDLSTCDSSTVRLKSVSSKAIKIHGMLLIAAWAYLAPFATVAARSKNSGLTPGALWLKVHAVMQLAALALTAAGLAKAITAVGRADGVDHLTGRHPKLGVGVACGAALNLVMGALRPHAPAPGEEKTAQRWAFEILHRVVGYGVLILGVITVMSGVHRAGELEHINKQKMNSPWNLAITIPVAIAEGLIWLLSAYICCKKKPPADVPLKDPVSAKHGTEERKEGEKVVLEVADF